MKVLNLGCGIKTSDKPNVVNIDWSPYLRVSKSRVGSFLAPLVLDKSRLKRFRSIPQNIMVANLAKGIPFGDETVDVVYHSHVLEHLDRPVALAFLKEAFRVLKPGGIIRIVVPDIEMLTRAYLDHLELCKKEPSAILNHEDYLAPMIEQCVRREADGTAHQTGMRRYVENRLLGDARQRGETHQWMYDRFILQAALQRAGYRDTQVCRFDESWVEGWNGYGLDLNEDGSQYKKDSLYMEGRKGE